MDERTKTKTAGKAAGKTLTLARMRKDALAVFKAGIKAVDPSHAVRKNLRRRGNKLTVGDRSYDLGLFQRVFIIGTGKAAAAMARPIEDILQGKLTSGIVNVKYGHSVPLNRVRVNEAGHPVPDEAGLRGGQQIIHLLEETGRDDLVFFLISGGGSALLPAPAQGLTLEDKQQTTKSLLECGATIHEINAVRKHISRVKGGRLAKLAYPSTLVSLILSDVIGDDLDIIASGPTVPDRNTFGDCLDILDKHSLRSRIPASVLGHLEKGARGEIEDTPKPEDPAFEKTQNIIIGSNILAVNAAREKAAELGYNTVILSSFIEGETREIAKMHAAMAREILSTGNPVPRPACLISGGETTVTLQGTGLGGRNQEFALAAAMEIEGLDGVVVLSGGTDGTDGPTGAAGAIADGTTIQRAKKSGLSAWEHLRNNDSYHFFQPLNDLIITGPTHTNVMDLRLVMVA